MKSNTIILIISTLGIAGGAYYWYQSIQTGNEAPLTAGTVVESKVQIKFKTLVTQLQPISFDTKIFADSRFRVLVDLKTPVTNEPSGRLDPFAQIAGVSAK